MDSTCRTLIANVYPKRWRLSSIVRRMCASTRISKVRSIWIRWARIVCSNWPNKWPTWRCSSTYRPPIVNATKRFWRRRHTLHRTAHWALHPWHNYSTERFSNIWRQSNAIQIPLFHFIWPECQPFQLRSNHLINLFIFRPWFRSVLLLPSRAHRLLKGLPNTYAYTKALTEDLVNSYAGRLPIVITRPSIGMCATHLPLPLIP